MSDIVFTAMKAVQMMVGDDTSPELVIVSDPGSSGARVFIIRHPSSHHAYAVKCVRNGRISLADEIAKREIIEPLLLDHLPKILSIQQLGEYEVMISECRGEQTLHSLIVNSLMPQSRLTKLWREIVTTLIGTWKQTKHYPFMGELCPRYHKARCQRITEGVYALTVNGIRIADCASMPVIVNGEEYPSIRQTLPQIEAVGSPKFGVTCHGDPQPSNVVVDKDCFWSLVDWEWSGRHQDWRTMVSHLYGWWPTRCSVLMMEPQLRVRQGKIYIDYSLLLPPHMAEYQDEAVRAYQEMSEDVGRSFADATDINRYLATLYFGELRFLHFWNRECYLIPILAEAIKVSSSLMGRHVPSVSPFAFNPKERRPTVCTDNS